MEKASVICIGLTVTDVLVQPIDLSLPNSELIMVDNISNAVGGDAFNEAYTLARLGIPVKLMASVGSDSWGDFIIAKGSEAGIDMENVTRSNEYPTTVSIVLVRDDGERSFICSSGTAQHFMPESLDIPSIENAKVVSLASLFPNIEMSQAFLTAAKAAKKAGAIVTVDVAEGLDAEVLKSHAELFTLADFIFPNYDQACKITGETSLKNIADVFLKCGVKNAVIKTGKNGCYFQNKDETLKIPTYKNAKRIDTTGAGDNFAAGFIYGLCRDLSIKECAAYANAAASVSIQYLGAGGVKNLQEVTEMMSGETLEIAYDQ